MKIKDAISSIASSLTNMYDEREAKNIAYLLMDHVLNLSKEKILSSPDITIEDSKEKILLKALDELKTYRPIQYIIGHTLFYGCTIHVCKDVLIPRPETEELVQLIITDQKNKSQKIKILDIGTGSGCIAIALKKNLPDAIVHAADISEKALSVARKNALENNTEIIFHQFDILDDSPNIFDNGFDIIVSNPPYVRESEKVHMNRNVLDFEPHISLFVPDDDPMKFYNAIARFSEKELRHGGLLYLEINEALANETAEIFKKINFTDISTKEDIRKKLRFLTCRKP